MSYNGIVVIRKGNSLRSQKCIVSGKAESNQKTDWIAAFFIYIAYYESSDVDNLW